MKKITGAMKISKMLDMKDYEDEFEEEEEHTYEAFLGLDPIEELGDSWKHANHSPFDSDFEELAGPMGAHIWNHQSVDEE